jgi:hypothetical protein
MGPKKQHLRYLWLTTLHITAQQLQQVKAEPLYYRSQITKWPLKGGARKGANTQAEPLYCTEVPLLAGP